MAKPKRQIVTFTSLVQRVEDLRKRDFGSWERLVNGVGTRQLLPKAKVRFSPSDGRFEICSDGSVGGTVVLMGMKRDGRWITMYWPHVTPTKFPRFVFDTYTPIEFVGGKPMGRVKSSATAVRLHDLRGSVVSTHWVPGRRRGGIGRLNNSVLIDDATGLFADARFARTDFADQAELSLPYLPLASNSVKEWLASMDEVPGANAAVMKDLGMRCLKVAARLCGKHEGMKVRAFPAHKGNVPCWTHGQRVWMEGSGWFLPEVLLFWHDWTSDHGTPAHVSVSFQIPPHGRPDMDYTRGPAPHWCLDHFDDQAETYNYLYAKSPDVSWAAWGRRSACWRTRYADLDSRGQEAARLYAHWSELPDCVRITRRCKMKRFPRVLVKDTPAAMRPEDFGALLEESVLMSSLPVC